MPTSNKEKQQSPAQYNSPEKQKHKDTDTRQCPFMLYPCPGLSPLKGQFATTPDYPSHKPDIKYFQIFILLI